MPKREVTRSVGLRRLAKLAAFLKTVPRKRFVYGSWVGEDWKGAQDLSCGTTACALGWAATMPFFRKLGMRFIDFEGFGVVVLNRKEFSWPGYRAPFRVAQEVFAINEYEADYLFSATDLSEEDATPKQVARKIETFIKRNGMPHAEA